MLLNAEVIIDSLVLSAVGMSVVFVFLACLVGVLSLLKFVQGDDPVALPTHHRHSASSVLDKQKQAAAIAVSIHEFEKSREYR